MLNISCFLSANKEVNSAAPDPSLPAVPWMLAHTTSATLSHCNTCISGCNQPLSEDPPFLKSTEGHNLTLNYEPQDGDHIVKEIVAMGRSSIQESPPLTAAFLLCLSVQYSATSLRTSDLRRVLLLIASGVQSAVWVSYLIMAVDIFVASLHKVTVCSEKS